MIQNGKRIIVAITLLVVFFVIRYFNLTSYITLENVQYYLQQLETFTTDHYGLSVFYFMMVMIFATLGSVPVTVLLTVLSGYLYGTILGALYSVVGATIGGIILVVAVRYVLGDYLQKKYHHKLIEFNQELDEYGMEYIFFIQLLPLTPAFMLNVLVGLSKIPVITYALTAVFGMLPAATIYAFAGRQIEMLANIKDIIQPWMVNLTIVMVILFIMFFSWGRFPILPSRLFKKIIKRRKKK